MSIGYDDTGYEKYDSEKIKKKRKFVMKPLHFNITNISVLIVILTIIFLLYDYCSYNFDIDLEEEYKNYNESDLMFGKKNICQYVRDKYVYEVLLFKQGNMSIAVYVILFIILLIVLYTTGILEQIGVYIIDKLQDMFTINTILYGSGLFSTIKRLIHCSDDLFFSLFNIIF